uniref:Uncharacterized protein n=1 Tax=Anguilla anguilla TaxID=7936 RepID=A0A0E9X814_ANGAN
MRTRGWWSRCRRCSPWASRTTAAGSPACSTPRTTTSGRRWTPSSTPNSPGLRSNQHSARGGG